MFKYRKSAAKGKKYSSHYVWGQERIWHNDSAKKKQEKNYEPGVVDYLGML